MKEDKKLYSYKQALSQPYWLQRFNDDFSLKTPVKFSRLVYTGLLFGLSWQVMAFFIGFAPFGLRGVVSAFFAWQVASFLSDVVIDDKSLIFYLKDYLVFYFRYGLKSDSHYINKGQVYEKPKALIRKEK